MTISLATVGNSSTTGVVTSQGLGSGINISSLVTSLVSAEISPQQTLLQSQQTGDQATISALGSVKSALSSLQSSVDAITSGGALQQLSAQSSSSSVFTAAATSSAAAGSYQVQVQTLAAANTIQSSVFSSANATVGTGPYSITAGGKTFSVSLTNSNDTLSGLAAAINGSSSNSGASATVVNGTSGSYLLLSATQTGTANAVSVSNSSPISFTTVPGQTASDATGTIDGIAFDSASNIVSNALTGVSLALTGTSPSNTTQTLTVSANTTSAASAVQSFVSAYNSALSLITTSTAYTPGTSSAGSTTTASGTAGPLLGDIAVESLQQQLQSIVGGNIGGTNAFTLLSQIGVTANSDGTLAVNSASLSNALQQNTAAVQSLFSGSNGIGTRLDTLLNQVIGTPGTTGMIDTETNALQSQVTSMNTQLSNLTAESAQLTAQYNQEFNAMDTVVAGYKNTSNLLTQLYAPRTTSSSSSGS
ncbi:MAG: flagellar filament capping protein FliD [Nevskia sp.]|nr:flagellar filament capping protein FliD [Nevskia sp.]